jgi:hypothetical protein
MDFLRQRKGQFLSPMESPTHPGHSLTYIEAASLEPDKLAWPDQHQPSFKDAGLGRYPLCPSFTFISKAEKRKHFSIIHDLTPKFTATLDCSGRGGAKVQALRWACPFKSRGVLCGRRFKTRSLRTQHQVDASHMRQGRAVAAR